MKTKYTMMAALLVCSGVAFAQEVDDMYFNARDRVTHTEATQATLAMRYASEDQQAVKGNPVNPSDTYTGRGVNPEYNAQQKNGAEIVQGNPDYFLANYQAKGINSNQYANTSTYGNNCACSNAYSGFGNPYGNFYSPYGYGYSPYSMMGYGMYPYGMGYGSSVTMSMMYGMGSLYGGYGMPYGMGMYNPYGYGYGPTNAYVTGYDVGGIPTTYGHRTVRNTSASANPFSSGQNPSLAQTNGRNRVAGQTTRADYYDAQWRNDPNNFPTRSYGGGRSSNYWSSPSSATGGRSSGWESGTGGRTRSYDSFGSSPDAGSRSGGFSSAPSGGSSSGGGGRSRGRN